MLGRIGETYHFPDPGGPWRLTRVDELYHFEGPGGNLDLSLGRFAKLTARLCSPRFPAVPGGHYEVPCIQCRLPVPQPGPVRCSRCPAGPGPEPVDDCLM